MSRLNQIIIFSFFTIFLFPLLTGADDVLHKSYLPIPFLPILLLLSIFVPVFLKIVFDNKGKELVKIYSETLWITVPFLIVALIAIIWSLHPGAYWDRGFRKLIMYFYEWVLLMLTIPIAYSLTIRKFNQTIFFIILLGACLAIWVDLMSPGTFSHSLDRAAGFAGNANWGGRVIIFLAIAAINWEKNNFINWFILVLSGLAVYATLSVGNLLLYLMVVVYYLYLNLMGKMHLLNKLTLIMAIPLLILFVVQPLLLDFMNSQESFSSRTSQERIDEISEFFSVFSTEKEFVEDHERIELAKTYWGFIQEMPLMGQGTGFTSKLPKGPHNMFINQWVENGLLGLLAYLALIGCAFRHFVILKNSRGIIFIIIFFGSSFFDDKLLHYNTFVILLGILGVLAYLENSKLPTINLDQKQAL